MPQSQFETCMEACLACAKTCREHAQSFRGHHGNVEFVEACRECEYHCLFCCSDLRDNSPLLVHSARMCALACDLCALACQKLEAEHGDRCLLACRQCAEECRSVRGWIGQREVWRIQMKPDETVAAVHSGRSRRR
jgi:hypothetical protein